MLKVKLITVGKLKEKYWEEALAEYCKRLTRFIKLEITEIPDFPDSIDTKEKEAALIIPKLEGHIILFDVKGKLYSSPEFSRHLEKLTLKAGTVTFIIGGSLGVSDSVKAISNEQISFSGLTFPHQLFRVMVLEQLYRACTIINNINYHK